MKNDSGKLPTPIPGERAADCADLQGRMVAYLDGRNPAQRRGMEDHLAVCAECRARSDEFRAVWNALDEIPVIAASGAFDAALRQCMASDALRRRWWGWAPTPKLALATAAMVAVSVWMVGMPRFAAIKGGNQNHEPVAAIAADADFPMIRDLPVLENYEVLSTFDALSELPPSPENPVPDHESR